MSPVGTAALLFWALTALTVLTIVRDLLRYDLRLELAREPASDHGLVSVIVPMRNEAGNVDRCLAAIRSQSYANLEVVVVDDASTDGTGERLARWQEGWPALRVVSSQGPPPGWAGKTHALHRGIAEAHGEWLLLIDADVVLSEQAVATTVATADRNGWPVLSLHGQLTYDTFWERGLLLPVAVLTHLFQVEIPCSVLNGQFILMRRATYEAIGGYPSIRGAVVEDAALASRLVECGIRPRVRLWPAAYRCRMYTSRAAMWEGLTRMLAGYNRFRTAPLVGVAVAYGTVLLPQAVLLGLALAALLGGPGSGVLAVACGSLVAAHLACLLVTAHRLGAPLAVALLKPIADLNVTAVLLDSARRAAFGRVTWKGRRYVAAQQPEAAEQASDPVSTSEDATPGLSIVIVLGLDGPPDDPRIGSAPAWLADLASRHPEIEFVAVHPGSPAADELALTNAHVVTAPAGSLWQLRRAGVASSRGPIVACVDATPEDPSLWIDSVLAAFDDPQVHLVTGPVRYDAAGALAEAASIREWGHLTDPWTCYPSSECFAGRRELLLRLLPAGDPTPTAGGILLGMLAAIEGEVFRVVPGAMVRVPMRHRWVGSITRAMVARMVATVSLTEMAVRWPDRQPSMARLGARLVPLAVWGDTVLLTLRSVWTNLDRLRVPGVRRPAVLLWMNLLAALDLGLALHAITASRSQGRSDRLVERSEGGAEWQDRIYGIVFRMLVNPRHRRASSGLVSIR